MQVGQAARRTTELATNISDMRNVLLKALPIHVYTRGLLHCEAEHSAIKTEC